MKKRILSLIVAIILIIPFFVFSVSAISITNDQMLSSFDIGDIVISSDYQTLTVKDTTYVRFDSSMTFWETSSYHEENDCTYLDDVDYISYDIGQNACMVTATVYYNDGSYFCCYFIKKSLLEEHNNLLSRSKAYTIVFSYDEKINLSATDLSATAVQIDISEIDFFDTYDANVYSDGNNYYIEKGSLSLIDGKYYYIDYKLNNIESIYSPKEETTSLTAYEVINADLIAEFDNITGNGKLDVFDLIISGKLFSGVGTVLLFVIFAFIPLVTLVLFLVLSIVSKTPSYKKLFAAICITSVFELVVFAASVILLIVFR